MSTYLSIGKTAEFLGVSIQTLRNWDKSGLLMPDKKTQGGARRYSLESLTSFNRSGHKKSNNVKLTVAYARVPSKNNSEDLARQVEVLKEYCEAKSYNYEIIHDIGGGLNFYKKGLKDLVSLISSGKVERLVITHKDRLLKFGSEIIFTLCEANNVELLVINSGNENMIFEEDDISNVGDSFRFAENSEFKRSM